MERDRYDMEFGGSFYPLANFVRSVTLAAKEKDMQKENLSRR